MSRWFLLFPMLAVLALTGCREFEFQFERGEIPEEFQHLVQDYLGSYSGEFGDQEGHFILERSGNTVNLSYLGSNGSDLLDPRCRSQIGELISVQVKTGESGRFEVAKALFAFDPGECSLSVQGRELVLSFTRKDSELTINTSLLLTTELEPKCRIEPGNPASGLMPRKVCDPQPTERFRTGKLRRASIL